MQAEANRIEKLSQFIKNSVILKLITITLLMLLLLIPSTMIKDIIRERESLSRNVTAEVSSKWANKQCINGPILTIPVSYTLTRDDEVIHAIQNWHILPESLIVNGSVDPQKLKRGIYETVVYKSNINLSGDFNVKVKSPIQNATEIHYDRAFLTVGISDLRGIKNNIQFNWGEEFYSVEPGSRIQDVLYSGFTIPIDINTEQLEMVSFHFDLDLQGSENLSFTPLGKATKVEISSTWPDPSFVGNFLPDNRSISDEGFTADWSVLQLNRNYPQSWAGNNHSDPIEQSAFGVDFILPLDDYQKSLRSAKYAVMTIALTFLIFFLVEILNKRRIHPFQYAFVGLALCLFYVLIVSISEHSQFNFAYGISAISIILMISLYSLSIFKKPKLSLLLSTILVGIYGFLFVTLQLTDYALLLGSLGLTLILGLTMYFTRNINWYGLNFEHN